ncbi:proline dehydrogenase family protein [Geothrix sp. 21YS21S-4]|uniref:proline dehydrogenase family protein n=1 Tax=Geothrix sp. 21YS21S-4 TaxID=3068889 RepID=UPI0027B9EC75|nr:proline dehydrogenase family protein [Geothrix sp. 21YS21S-4]
MIRTLASVLARQAWFRKAVLGTPVLRDLAGRFVGGDDLSAGLAAVRGLNARGIRGSLNFHGMHATDPAEAIAAADEALDALHRIRAEGLDSHVSVKLTKLGLDVDPNLCLAQLRRVLDGAAETGGFVRIDMEEAVYVDQTLGIFEAMQDHYGAGTVGLVIQSYLRGRERDLDRLLERGARVRLVKGGYRESAAAAFRSAAEVDAAFRRDIERLLARGVFPAIATHDAGAVAWAQELAAQMGMEKTAFEFQMLYGVKPALQDRLVAEGYAVRCYVPYGGDWATHLVGCLRRLPASALAHARGEAA